MVAKKAHCFLTAFFFGGGSVVEVASAKLLPGQAAKSCNAKENSITGSCLQAHPSLLFKIVSKKKPLSLSFRLQETLKNWTS